MLSGAIIIIIIIIIIVVVVVVVVVAVVVVVVIIIYYLIYFVPIKVIEQFRFGWDFPTEAEIFATFAFILKKSF